MPIYEYKCEKCEHVFEMLVGSSENQSKIHCEKCGSSKLKKLISAPYVSVKEGSGTITRCGKDNTCCGSSTPCDTPSCGH